MTTPDPSSAAAPAPTFDELVSDAASAHPFPSAQAPQALRELTERIELPAGVVAPTAPAPTLAQAPPELRDFRGNLWDPTRHGYVGVEIADTGRHGHGAPGRH